MIAEFEYVIIGAGVVGSAAAYLLSRQGKSVAIFEQFAFCHERGSSHGESRIIRYAYGKPVYVKMAKQAYSLWYEIMADSKEKIFTKTGGIDIFLSEDKKISEITEALSSENIDYELFDSVCLPKQFTQFHVSKDRQILYQSEAGVINASLAVKSLLNLAKNNGAELKENTAIQKIEFETDSSILLTCLDQVFKCKKLILAAGAWMLPLLQGLGLKIPLYVTQEQYAYFKPRHKEKFLVSNTPIFICRDSQVPGGVGFYGFPILERESVKCALHLAGKRVSAETRDFEINQEQINILAAKVQELMPDLTRELDYAGTCLYTNSADEDFVIDTLPGNNRVSFFTGCSGHSFKFAPMIAEMLIDLVDKPGFEIYQNVFSQKRFAKIGGT